MVSGFGIGSYHFASLLGRLTATATLRRLRLALGLLIVTSLAIAGLATRCRRHRSGPAEALRMMPAGAMGPSRRAADTTVRSVKDLHSERTVVFRPPHRYGPGGFTAWTPVMTRGH